MSEVKEHSVIYLAPACHEDHMQREWCEDDVWSACEECGSKNTSVRYNLGTDFDRVTAERDALQQRLTAADELNDNRDSEIFAQVQSALRRSFSLGQIYWQQADSDSTRQQNKSDQTMAVQEQHILNVLKSLGAALKPAEVKCKTCHGTRTVSDGAMYCSSGGIPFECGPIECVKDCPDCTKP